MKRSIAAVAAALPLMGAERPRTWLKAAKAVQRFKQYESGAAAQAAFAGAKEVMGNLGEGLSQMKELLDQVPDLPEAKGGVAAVCADGAELRVLRKMLDELDKVQRWGGLKKVYTPEGHYLWLCPEHAVPYQM